MILEIPNIEFFLIALMVVAFLYASVGHGGASGYLALMSLFSFAPEVMKPTALMLNLFVAAIAFFHYYKGGYFKLKLFLSFAITSIPMAFIGGMIEIDASLYKKVLGVLLIFAILKMLNVFGNSSSKTKGVTLWKGLLIGAVIGFASGLIGIGGGIILTPIILLLHWGKMKEAAAVSALFIWVNSASGLIGQISSGVVIQTSTFILAAFAIVGGYFGGKLGSKQFNNKSLRYLLVFVLIISVLKLFLV